MISSFSQMFSFALFKVLKDPLSQYTIHLMALFIPHRCPKCFKSVTLIQPQHKGGALKGQAKSKCLNCMDEQEYDLNVPVNKKAALVAVKPKAKTLN